jgi:hypothetical protein
VEEEDLIWLVNLEGAEHVWPTPPALLFLGIRLLKEFPFLAPPSYQFNRGRGRGRSLVEGPAVWVVIKLPHLTFKAILLTNLVVTDLRPGLFFFKLIYFLFICA